MIPVLYSEQAELSYKRIGALVDAISCHVVEERNGRFYLEMEYPINGQFGDQIANGRVIEALTSERETETNYFYILNHETDISGIVHVYAEQVLLHRCRKIIVASIQTISASGNTIMQAIKNAVMDTLNFSIIFISKGPTGVVPYGFDIPRTLKGALFGQEGSLLDALGKGELEWQRNKVTYWATTDSSYDTDKRGTTYGRSAGIDYGVNLIDYKFERDSEDQYTSCVAYWQDKKTGTLVTGRYQTPRIIYQRTMLYDASEDYDTAPTQAVLKGKAQEVLDERKKSEEDTVINIKFVPKSHMQQDNVITREANGVVVGLCDTIPVHISQIGLDSTLQIIKTDYNVLTELYNSVEAGTPRKSLGTALAQTAYRTGVSLFK